MGKLGKYAIAGAKDCTLIMQLFGGIKLYQTTRGDYTVNPFVPNGESNKKWQNLNHIQSP